MKFKDGDVYIEASIALPYHYIAYKNKLVSPRTQIDYNFSHRDEIYTDFFQEDEETVLLAFIRRTWGWLKGRVARKGKAGL